jgi:TM2 domain-containing membrane protein YozV
MSNIPPRMPSSDVARLMQYDAAKKSAVIAYLLWFFLAGWGVHRLYLGRIGSGVVMAIISALSWITVYVGIGLLGLAIIGIWWLLDAFLIPGIVVRANLELASRLGA